MPKPTGQPALSRRLQIRLSPEEMSRLRELSERHGLSLGSVIRLLLAEGLEGESGLRKSTDQSTALAALVASEHGRLLLETIVPQGQARSSELRELAVAAAEVRLAALRRDLRGENDG